MDSNNQPNPKPLAGIVTSLVLGTIGIIWSLMILYHDLYTGPQGLELILANLFPSFMIIGFFTNSMLLLTNTIIIIGAFLSYLQHPYGNKIVKIICLISILMFLVFTILSYEAVINSKSWWEIDVHVRSTVIGGIIGGGIGAISEFLIIFLLFRKYK
jgi:hypothetical protein